MEDIKISYENTILKTQLEMQEQTFQNISREIHDNIGQKLTLAKLQLNTLTNNDEMESTIDLIGDVINDLSDISRSMSSEQVLQNGLIKGLEFEVRQLAKAQLFDITLRVTGETVFLDANRELILFRVVQEGINNIIKHAKASVINIFLYFKEEYLLLNIEDNGRGFGHNSNREGIGLENMKRRVSMLNGEFNIESSCGLGTRLNLKIPYYGS